VVDCYGPGDAKTWGAGIKARILGTGRLRLKLVGDGRDEVHWWLALCTKKMNSRIESRVEEHES
jgi:hypothetical protein